MDEKDDKLNESGLPLIDQNDQETDDKNQNANLPRPDNNRHVKIHLDVDNKNETSSIRSFHLEDSHIHDDHELAKPKDQAKNRCHAAQLYVKAIVEHLAFRLLTIFLIITEFIIVVIDLTINDDDHIPNLDLVSKIIMGYFVLELALRMFYMGERFFYSWMEIMDMVIVVLTFIIDLAFSHYARLGIIGRGLRIMRIIRGFYLMYNQRKQLASATRRIVSQNKRRYVKDGFDLDLCYITERVIAMSFPSSGIHSMYRNNIEEVSRFFNTKHSDHYRLYNLCSEREYNVDYFEGRVERVLIDDHNVPTVREMLGFCDSVHAWMSQDPDNVIAIHCKGGKGRTGTMICIWLVENGIFDEAQESLEYFGDRRTDLEVGTTFQGVETPSQSRFVGYFGTVKKELDGQLPHPKKLKIKSVKITAIKGVGYGDGTDLSMEVWSNRKCVFTANFRTEQNCKLTHDKENDYIEVVFKDCPVLVDDIKIRFPSRAMNIPSVYDNCAFYFWFHTAFVGDSLFLPREEIDNPHKKRAQKVFRENFSVEMYFQHID